MDIYIMYSTTQKGELSGGEKNTGNFRTHKSL